MVVDAVMAIGNDDRLNLIGIKKYFADCDIFCAGRVAEEDLNRVAAAAGGTVQTSVNNIIDEVLGTCEVFEEKQVGGERFNIFSGCPSGRTATIVLRGGTDQLVEEVERSLHDAIMRRVVKNSTVVPGGGAIDHSQWFTGCSFSICTGCFVLAPSSVKLPRQKGTQVDSLCVK